MVWPLPDVAVRRLHLSCAAIHYRSNPRLIQPPLSFQTDELLSDIAERLLKAIREAQPQTVRQFFARAD
jgi:RNA polymerase sigma-70 factor (ECF subfamily)